MLGIFTQTRDNNHPTNSIQLVRSQSWWISCAVIFVLKLCFLADNDTSAIGGGHDDYWCVQRALSGYWTQESFDEYAALREPLWPLFLSFMRQLGLPVRFVFEFVYFTLCIGATLCAWSQTRAKLIRPVLFFAVLFLNPLQIQVWNRATYDGLFAVTFLLSLVVLTWIIGDGRDGVSWRRAAIFGLSLGVSAVTRTEGQVLGCIGIPLLAGLAGIRGDGNLRRRLMRSSIAGVATIGGFLLIQAPFRIANQAIYGMTALSSLEEPNYKNAMMALASIDTGNTAKGVSITMEAVRKVAPLCPEGQVLRNGLEGSIGQRWSRTSGGYPIPPGEIGGGWCVFAIREVVTEAGFFRTAGSAQSFFSRLHDAIQSGFKSGALKKRVVFHPMVGPISSYTDLIGSAFNLVRLSFTPRDYQIVYDVPFKKVINDYDQAFNRKAWSIQRTGQNVTFEGYFFRKKQASPVVSAYFVDSRFGVSTSAEIFNKKHPALPTGYGAIGFRLSAPPGVSGKLHLMDYHQNGRILDVINGKLSGVEANEFADLAVVPGSQDGKGEAFSRNYGLYYFAWVVLFAISCAAMATQVVWNKKTIVSVLLGVVFLTPLVHARIGICAILDAGAFLIRDPRYLFPISLSLTYVVMTFFALPDKNHASSPPESPATG